MEQPTEPEYWWRAEDKRWAGGVDESGDPIPGSGSTTIEMTRLIVVSRTPKGVWLSWLGPRDKCRFVLNSARKRWASPTQEEALESLRARKKRQLEIYQDRVKRAQEVVAFIKNAHQELTNGKEYSIHVRPTYETI